MKKANPIDRAMLARIQSHRIDCLFTPADFIDLETQHAADKELSRMTASGCIGRVGRGLYNMPNQHPIVGTVVPSIEQVAKALYLMPVGSSSSQVYGQKNGTFVGG